MILPPYFNLTIICLRGFYSAFRSDASRICQECLIREDELDSVYEYCVKSALNEALQRHNRDWRLSDFYRHDVYISVYDHLYRSYAPYMYEVSRLNQITEPNPTIKLLVTGTTAVLAVGVNDGSRIPKYARAA